MQLVLYNRCTDVTEFTIYMAADMCAILYADFV